VSKTARNSAKAHISRRISFARAIGFFESIARSEEVENRQQYPRIASAGENSLSTTSERIEDRPLENSGTSFGIRLAQNILREWKWGFRIRLSV
jgi:hypothetical protein